MNHRRNRFTVILAVLLAIVLLTTSPTTAILGTQVHAAQPPVHFLDNGSIRVAVSTGNGGFAIRTSEGDLLNKSDDNQDLLYHSDWYDTSFTSFEITDQNGKVKEYLFGGNYSFLGLGGNNLNVFQDATGITAVWTVAQLTFTQRIELANTGSSEHGMVYLSYGLANNSGQPVKVRARVLLDTALGDQDFAYYEVVDRDNVYRHVSKETVLTTADYVPANFFGYDDRFAPTMTAYTVNQAQSMPYQVAFGHWNNLASTRFQFAPDSSLEFTNPYNLAYQTADSAYALYYDLGSTAAGATSAPIATYYGVYSNETVTAGERVSVNVSAPTALSLNADKTAYQSTYSGLADGTFSIQAQVNHIVQSGAADLSRVAVAVYAENGITPLDSFGHDLGYPVSYLSPYQIDYLDFKVGQTQTTRFYFKAAVDAEASFRKIEFKVFSLPETAQGLLLQENLLGSTSLYILCPGGNGNLPSILFTGSDPPVLYHEGIRQFHVTGTNFNMLEDKSRYSLIATNTAGGAGATRFTIPSENITFPETNVMDIIFKENMPAGSYELAFEWIDPPAGIPKSLKAPALRVLMSDDRKYKNDAYGVVAVVQIKNGLYLNREYKIRAYATEEQFAADRANYQEILLTFRGEFTVEAKNSGGPTKLSAVSGKSTDNGGLANANNLVTINNCIDFEGGKIDIYYDDVDANQSICVDFDGKLYTSQERSSIWSGYAAFTEIKNGQEFGLIPYNYSGERLSGFSENTITLIWPSGLSIAQTIGGMIFNLSYGELGVMYNDDPDTGSWPAKVSDLSDKYTIAGHVLSFSAALDLSFLIPQRSKTTEEKNWDSMIDWMNTEDQNGTLMRNRWNELDFNGKILGDEPAEKSKVTDEKTGKVKVQDILYGIGEGYIGFNCEVEVGLPPYTPAMPTMKGKLSIATINGWSLGVEGSMKFTTIEMEFDIGLIGYNGFPIPDKLYFFISGFEPGINVDGFGVLWITGGGGGFSDLYKTIFVSSGVPPLKLLLSASFDILKVLSARTDLSLSLRGIQISASDIKLKATDLKILNKAVLGFEWYPEFNFVAAVSADILGIVKGSGYLVVVNDATYRNFVEFFIRALISLPEQVPVVGGMTVGGVDLGVNNQQLWGVLSVIGIKLGISYYWGGEFDFGSGSDTASPTFPDLLALIDETGKTGITGDIPLYTDPKRGETLYMRVGNNASVSSPTRLVSELASPPALQQGADLSLLGSTTAVVQSTIDKLSHLVQLGAWNGESSIITLQFAAGSRAEALTRAAQIVVQDEATTPSTLFPIDLYDAAANGGAGNADTANANLTFDTDTGLATLAFTLTDSSQFGRTWSITTPVASDLILYDVAALPGVESVSVTSSSLSLAAGDSISLSMTGQFKELTSVSAYLVPVDEWTKDPGAAGTFLGKVSSYALYYAKSPLAQTFKLPKDLAAGSYVVKAVYRADGLSSGSVIASEHITVVNADQPADLVSVAIENSGDLKLSVQVDDSANDSRFDTRSGAGCDGYLLNVYSVDPTTGIRTLTDMNQLIEDKVPDNTGALQKPALSVGGRYQILEKQADGSVIPVPFGLTAGVTYQVGVTPCNYIYAADGETIEYTVNGTEVLSNIHVLRAATPPTISMTPVTGAKPLTRLVWSTDSNGQAAQVPVVFETFQTSFVRFNVQSDAPISGSWYLDGNAEKGGFFAMDAFTLALDALEEGDHTLRIAGTDHEGDSFVVDKVFTVDTTPPILLVSSPTNGSFFAADGAMTMTGICDPDSRMTLVVDGLSYYSDKTVVEAGGTVTPDGVFRLPVLLKNDVASHQLRLVFRDAVGNASSVNIRVNHAGLANIDQVGLVMSPHVTQGDVLDWAPADGRNIVVGESGETQMALALRATTGTGQTFILGADELVDWEVHTLKGKSALNSSGILTIEPGSYGYVSAKMLVAENGGLSSALTFGAEMFSSVLIPVEPTPTPTSAPTTAPTTTKGTQSTTQTTTAAPTETIAPTTPATTPAVTTQPASTTPATAVTTATTQTALGTPSPTPVPGPATNEGDPNNWLYVMLGLAAAALVSAIMWFAGRRRRAGMTGGSGGQNGPGGPGDQGLD